MPVPRNALHPAARRLLWRLTGGVLVGVLLAGSAVAATTAEVAPDSTVPGLDQTAALRASQAVVGTTIEDFTLLDREGRPAPLSRYRGKPLLVSFIYTGCFQICPLTTRALQNAIESGREVFGVSQFNVVSIGFNQPADSPQSMKSFALQHSIAVANWDFLSPPAAIVEPLTRTFGFSYLATPAGFDHTLQATMVDANGRIYRQIYGDELTADAIGEPLKTLLRDAPVAQQVRFDDIVDRVRILCTVYDPRTGKYRVKYDLLLEIAGGLTFMLAMLWFFGAEWLARRRSRRSAALRGLPWPP